MTQTGTVDRGHRHWNCGKTRKTPTAQNVDAVEELIKMENAFTERLQTCIREQGRHLA